MARPGGGGFDYARSRREFPAGRFVAPVVQGLCTTRPARGVPMGLRLTPPDDITRRQRVTLPTVPERVHW